MRPVEAVTDMRLQRAPAEKFLHDGKHPLDVPPHQIGAEALALVVRVWDRPLLQVLRVHPQQLELPAANGIFQAGLAMLLERAHQPRARVFRLVERLDQRDMLVFRHGLARKGVPVREELAQVALLRLEHMRVPDQHVLGAEAGKAHAVHVGQRDVRISRAQFGLKRGGIPPGHGGDHDVNACLIQPLEQVVQQLQVLVIDQAAFRVGQLPVEQVHPHQLHPHALKVLDVAVDGAPDGHALGLQPGVAVIKRRVVIHPPQAHLAAAFVHDHLLLHGKRRLKSHLNHPSLPPTIAQARRKGHVQY